MQYREFDIQTYNCAAIDVSFPDYEAGFAKIEVLTNGKYNNCRKSGTYISDPVLYCITDNCRLLHKTDKSSLSFLIGNLEL